MLTFSWPALTDMWSNIQAVGFMVLLDPAFLPFAGTIMVFSLLSTAISWIIPKPS
jgi:hypothetical protein